jgi:protein TonB
MVGNSFLKVAACISVGIHLLIFGIASSLFQAPKPFRTPARYVKVTIQPMATKEELQGKITLPVLLKVGDQDRKGPEFDGEGRNGETAFPSESIAKNIPFEEPKPVSKNKDEEEISGEPTNTMTAQESVLDSRPNFEKEGKRPSSKESISNGESGSISLLAFRSGEFDGAAFSYNSPGDGKGSGDGVGHSAGPGKGSRKGGGIWGKMFSSRGGGKGSRPSYADNPKPIYPQEAKEKGYEGEVLLRVEVLVNGRVGHIEIKKSSSYEVLDRSALTAVKQWRFIPAKRGDVAIPLWVNIPIKFQLQ